MTPKFVAILVIITSIIVMVGIVIDIKKNK